MGRHRTRDFDLPPGVYRKRDRYYFGKAGIALGGAGEWFAAYARLREGPPIAGATFADAAALYTKRELGKKAPKTQAEYRRQLEVLVRIFGHYRLDEIAPGDVWDMLEEAGAKRVVKGKRRGGPIAATRLKALLSTVFNFARGKGKLTAAPNPCAGIRGTKARRDRYVTDAELAGAAKAAKKAGDQVLADFLLLCYYTGANPSDVLRMTPASVQDGRLRAARSKTGRIARIRLAGPLGKLYARLARGCGELQPLIRNARGEPVRLQALRRRFVALGFDWWIADLRAKAASDSESLSAARDLLAHAAETTTDGYRRSRIGAPAEPVMRRIAGGRSGKKAKA